MSRKTPLVFPSLPVIESLDDLADDDADIGAVSGKSFTERVYPYLNARRGMGKHYRRVGPGAIPGVTLYPHQCTIVAAMLDLESSRKMQMSDGNTVVFSSATLSEPGGSGKTFACLALVLLSPQPRAFPMVYGTSGRKCASISVMKRLTDLRAQLTPTLIVVGTPVYVQWQDVITTNTTMTVLGVHDYRSFRVFQELLRQGQVNKYDVVLLRTGLVTGRFTIDGAELGLDQLSTCELMHRMTARMVWARAIYDDYDTCAMPAQSSLQNALFSWFVSASRKYKPAHDDAQFSVWSIPRVLPSASCEAMAGLLNVCVTTPYRTASKSVPKVRFYRYVLDNPDDAIIGALHGLDDEEVVQIRQMLNGDAHKAAAETLGIVANSAADIFAKILGDKHAVYVRAVKLLRHCEEQHAELEYLDETDFVHGPAELTKIAARLRKLKDPRITYYSGALEDVFDSVRIEAMQKRDAAGTAVDRMFANIKQNGCSVCKLAIGRDTGVFIIKCCGLIICDVCFARAAHVGKQYNTHKRGFVMGGRCPQCVKFVDLRSDIVFLNAKFDPSKLLEMTGDEDEALVEADESLVDTITSAAEDADAPADIHDLAERIGQIRNPKVATVIMIAKDVTPIPRQTEYERTNMVLMAGTEFVPKPPACPRKIIVFAHYAETIDACIEQLIAFKIPYLQVGGTAQEVHATLMKFRDGRYTILLINASFRCAGMDMPWVTDEIFMHDIADKHVAGQLAARAQRISRECGSLCIHDLKYPNENRGDQ